MLDRFFSKKAKDDIDVRVRCISESIEANSTKQISLNVSSFHPLLLVIGRSTESSYSSMYAMFPSWYPSYITQMFGTASNYDVSLSSGGGVLTIKNNTSKLVNAFIYIM